VVVCEKPSLALAGEGFLLVPGNNTVGIAREKIDVWFGDGSLPNVPAKTDHPIQEVRLAARQFALAILENTPPSADQSAAIRKVREAFWSAGQSIAFKD